jgi:hypothetical protein
VRCFTFALNHTIYHIRNAAKKRGGAGALRQSLQVCKKRGGAAATFTLDHTIYHIRTIPIHTKEG